ncbi:hypothetical protein E3N88_29466 [Mikania micrantha]|uniref:Uncharacterized protein n=1 Tax=Mikania micrantha TaxID=192012 RepID=A0A5N6MJA9_9ASTR|nr:hypothetical protein E3N88_29466 [Mikania micrantha]
MSSASFPIVIYDSDEEYAPITPQASAASIPPPAPPAPLHPVVSDDEEDPEEDPDEEPEDEPAVSHTIEVIHETDADDDSGETVPHTVLYGPATSDDTVEAPRAVTPPPSPRRRSKSPVDTSDVEPTPKRRFRHGQQRWRVLLVETNDIGPREKRRPETVMFLSDRVQTEPVLLCCKPQNVMKLSKQYLKNVTMKIIVKVQLYRQVREDETAQIIRKIQEANGSVVNMTDLLVTLTNNLIARVASGKTYGFQHTVRRIAKATTHFSVGNYFPLFTLMDRLSGLLREADEISKESDDLFLKRDGKGCRGCTLEAGERWYSSHLGKEDFT